MSCSQCPHCQSNAARASLRLPRPPGNYGRNGIDMGFYLSFGRAYDRARSLGPQPMVRLREVNPWMTESQCRSYLKRARTLGTVQTPGRGVQPAAASPVASRDPEPQERRPQRVHPLAGTTLGPAWESGVPVTRDMLRRLVCRTDTATDELWSELLAAGGVLTGDGIIQPEPVAG